MHRDAVFFSKPRQSLVAGHLVFLRHLRADGHHQIHRTDVLLYEAYDIFGGILNPENDYSILHSISHFAITQHSAYSVCVPDTIHADALALRNHRSGT